MRNYDFDRIFDSIYEQSRKLKENQFSYDDNDYRVENIETSDIFYEGNNRKTAWQTAKEASKTKEGTIRLLQTKTVAEFKDGGVSRYIDRY